MKKYKHVYCTSCVHYKSLLESKYINSDCGDIVLMPESCDHCYPFDPEDSRGNDLRVNYKESSSGWFWLTKNNIKEYFKYKMWRK